MANKKSNTKICKKVIIDTAPAAGGYYSDAIKPLHGRLTLFMTGTWSATITLQFRPCGETNWTDYDTTFSANTRQIIEDDTNCEWRIGVANAGFTSGTVTAGIETARY
jgi:hypothetical protein